MMALFFGLGVCAGQVEALNLFDTQNHDVSHRSSDEIPSALLCRIYKETTIHSNQLGMWDEEYFSCSPVVNDVESDDSFKISLPPRIKDTHLKDIEAGEFFVSLRRGKIEDDSVIGFSDDDIVMANITQPKKRKLQQVGRRTILVLRVSVRDSEPEFTGEEFRERIFGYDSLTVQSQYNKCSAGKLIFEPAPVGDGVIDVHLPGSVIADFVSTAALSNAAQLAAAELLNLPPDQHISSLSDHVMICLPPGTDGNNWVAAAAMNHWRSVYNNKFCGVISASMHELG
jgi:hypothetical protein